MPALRPRLSALALVVATLALSQPARAGLFEDDEARKAILDLRAKLQQVEDAQRSRLEQLATQAQDQQSAQSRSLLDLSAQIEALRAEIAKLREQNEQLARDLAETQRRVSDQAQNLDSRLKPLEPQKVSLDGKEFNVEPEERRQYEAAIGAVRKGDFAEAVGGFNAFLKRYPGSGYADSARFWLGNAQYGKRDYKDASKADFADLKELGSPWYDDDGVAIAEYWHREQVTSQIVALSNDTVVKLAEYEERAEEYAALGVTIVGKPREVKSHKVTQYIVNGVEVLDTVEWPGKYIPIVAVYGDTVVLEGKRHFYSLIDGAIDAQRNHNYWESCITGAIALAPVSPFIGPEGAFDAAPEKWSNINDPSIATVEYAGPVRPTREPPPAYQGAMIERAQTAIAEMKAIIGLHEPSLGERSGADSGVAIRSLQRQGDVATFHFLDNLTRSIRHAGRILLDLIGKVYTTPRILRVLGEDMQPQVVQAAPQDMQQDMLIKAQMRGQEIARIYDLTAGKYDLVVKAGPSFGTQREYAQAEIVEIIRAFPDSAPILGPMYLENSDWPGATEAAEQLKALAAGQMGGEQPQGPDPQLMAQMQQMAQQLQALAQENEALKRGEMLKAEELRIKGFEAETRRFEAQAKAENDALDRQSRNAEALIQARMSNPYAMEGTQ